MRNDRMCVVISLSAAASMVCASAQGQWSQDDGVYSLYRIGFYDAAHTHTNGTRYSTISAASATGAVFGVSTRYSSGQLSSQWAQSAWRWAPAPGGMPGGTLERIGLTGAPYTATSGHQHSSIWGASAEGWCLGMSSRYSGNAYSGVTTWALSPDGAYSTLGLVEVENGGDGVQPLTSTPVAMNAAGQAIGIAQRTFPDTSMTANRAGWFWSPQTGNLRLGYFDAAYTHAEGMQTTQLGTLTDTGYVIGSSSVYNGLGGVVSTTAWVFSPQRGTTRLTLGYTGPNGAYVDGAAAVNNAGWVTGTTGIWATNQPSQTAAWVARPLEGGGAGAYSVERIGVLNDPNDPGSLQDSSPTCISEDGWVGGRCAHVSMASVHGNNAWVWTPQSGVSERVGLVDATHTRSNDGTQSSGVFFIAGGVATGTSSRYLGTADNGADAWVWRPGAGTAALGLFDSRHTLTGGYRWHTPVAIDAAGNIIGTSRRFTAAQTDAGQSGWYRSAATGIVTPLVFSVNPATQYARTQPRCFAPDGSVLGMYVDVVTNTEKAFIWRPGIGFADLASRIDAGLAYSGFVNLADVYTSQPAARGVIPGLGRITGAAALNGQAFVAVRVPGCGRADVGSAGGDAGADAALDNNDFVAFIALFFAGDARADIGRTGGLLGADGAFDNNDFVAFIDRFFAGC